MIPENHVSSGLSKTVSDIEIYLKYFSHNSLTFIKLFSMLICGDE